MNKFPSSVTAILQPRFRAHMTLKSLLTPDLEPGLESIWASTWLLVIRSTATCNHLQLVKTQLDSGTGSEFGASSDFGT